LQVVLFGQPELDERLNHPSFRQLKQRISFSYYLPLMSRDDLDNYIFHRTATAGNAQANLFTKKARDILYRSSHGIPRIVNILSHKALLAAYGKGETEVTPKIMRLAIQDSEMVMHRYNKFLLSLISTLIFLITFVLFL